MKVLVTGGRGMLGQTLCNLCKKLGIFAYGAGKEEIDITSKETIIDAVTRMQPTHLVNCAAYTDVDGAEREGQKAFDVNAKGAGLLAEASRAAGIHFTQISTDYVFDGAGVQPYTEEDLCSPINAYGRSKWEGEQLVLSAYKDACIIRTSWLFGCKGKNTLSSLFTWLREKQEVCVVSDQWGRLTFVEDLAQAIMALCDQSGVFHFANAGAVSRYEIAEEMRRLAHKKGIELRVRKIQPVSADTFLSLAPRPRYSVLDTAKFTSHGHKPPRPWKEALEDFLVVDDA